MELERGKISASQFTLLIIGSMLGSAVVLSPGLGAGNNSWLTVPVGLAMAFLFIWIILKLAGDYPDKTLVEINNCILGPYIGKIFSLLYIWYFFHIGSIVLRDFADFISNLMAITPIPVFVLITLLLPIMMVRNGLEVIVRSSMIIAVSSYLLLLLAIALIANEMELSNLLPFMDISLKELLTASYEVTIFPFGETIVFLMMAKFVNNHSKVKNSIITALIFAAIFGTLFHFMVITSLGDFMEITSYPGYQALRRIDIAGVITRIDILGAAGNLTTGVVKVTVMLYATVLGISQMFKLRSYRQMSLPVGALMFILSIIQFNNSNENLVFHRDTYPYYAIFFQAVLPALTLLTDRIKKLLPGNRTTHEQMKTNSS